MSFLSMSTRIPHRRRVVALVASVTAAAGSLVGVAVSSAVPAHAGTALPSFAFDRVSYSLPGGPTSMAWGPDGRLYVGTYAGTIHALTVNAADQVTADQSITTMGNRFVTGLAFDPASTAADMTLWVDSNYGQLSGAPDDSGVVSSLNTVDGFADVTRTDVITGLPRSNYNHMNNEIHFAPPGAVDAGELFISAGSKTADGAVPNVTESEFEARAEEPLSSAILVANVDAPGFNGNCADSTPNDPATGVVNCDVQVFADGVRNAFDFTWAQTATAGLQLYGGDNGNNVKGTFPPSTVAPCYGIGTVGSYKLGYDTPPGVNNDPLDHFIQGDYYGQPDPARGDCVYLDGQYQQKQTPKAVPPANYSGAMTTLGVSPDGIIQYHNQGAYGDPALDGLLLNTVYSDATNQDIVAVGLSGDGNSVTSQTVIATGFDHPLPISEGPDGVIWVGEFGNYGSDSVITALIPVTTGDIGTWTQLSNMPTQIYDNGGAALDGLLYSVDGKVPGSGGKPVWVNDVFSYDPATDTWAKLPGKPGSLVQNPVVIGYNHLLYVFGGTKSGFTGAVTDAYVYDPATQVWTALAPSPDARGEAAGGVLPCPTGNPDPACFYIAGGLTGNGTSIATMDIYDPTTNTWTHGPSMDVPRDDPGAAVINGQLYVMGGRYEKSQKSVVIALENTMEMYDPATGTWTDEPDMPTARRNFSVGTVNNMIQVVGGEITGALGTFPENEQYDPTTQTWTELAQELPGRQGTAYATINNVFYSAGGAPIGQTGYSNITESFNE